MTVPPSRKAGSFRPRRGRGSSTSSTGCRPAPRDWSAELIWPCWSQALMKSAWPENRLLTRTVVLSGGTFQSLGYGQAAVAAARGAT